MQAGRWWSIGDVEIGPFGSRQCFGGDCRPAGLGWIGATESWLRLGIATWAAGLLTTVVLVGLASGVAAKRTPKLVARMALVAIATAGLAGTAFFLKFPGLDGASVGRGPLLYGIGVACGALAAILVLRRRG